VPDAAGIAALAGATGIGVASYLALTMAMRMGEVSVITPFRYSRLVFALILAVALLGERPDMATLIGSAIVVGSGIYTLIRTHRANRTHTTH
jgi:drug/metabolite transporter (DMT)-like permease